MSRQRPKRRKQQIKIKQLRKQKLAKLREKYQTAKSQDEKKKVIEKLHRIAPWLSREEFLEPVEKSK